MDFEALRQSAVNVAFFAGRVPQALRRRNVGSRYLEDHPEIRRDYTLPRQEAVVDSVRALAPTLRIEPLEADAASYADWVRNAQYPLLAYHSSAEEKFLEHELSVKLLEDRCVGTLIDVASWRSFFPHLMRKRGFRVIVQDLVYAQGLHGDVLGCNAASFPLPDGSVDAMTLHCSFEHFEGTADSDFVREASRLLKAGGRVVIIPLYLHEERITWVDPYFLAIGEKIVEPGATWQPAVGYANRFGRMYDPKAFVERVVRVANSVGLVPTLWVVKGAPSIAAYCYVQFALTLDKPE